MTDKPFERLEDGGEESLGPEAALLCGFSADEVPAIRALLGSIGAGEHRTLLCSDIMLSQKLREALKAEEALPPLPPDKLPRVMVLSGLPGDRVRDLLAGYKTTGLPRPIFAVTTASNLDFTVRELLVDLLREQRAMMEGKGR